MPATSPPPYLLPPPTASTPGYTSRAASSEYVLLSSRATVAPDMPSIAQLTFPDYHQSSSKHLVLNLGPRVFRTDLPAYGKGATIDGFVEIKKHEHVSSVALTIEGTVATKAYERGLVVEHKTCQVLNIVVPIYERKARSTEPVPSSPFRYPFSVTLPTTLSDGSPLPPSFMFTHSSQMDATVSYVCRVDCVRKGFRMHESLRMAVLYLPRSYSPPPEARGHRMSLSTALDTKTMGIDCHQWKTTRLSCSDSKLEVAVTGEMSLPRPEAYAASLPIPFIVSVVSHNAVSPEMRQQFLSQPIIIQLLKVVRTSAGRGANSRQAVLADGEIWRDWECQAYTEETGGEGVRRVVRGTLQGGRVGGEMSWSCTSAIHVKYYVRVAIKSTAPTLWPTLEHDELIEITTHEWQPPSRSETGAIATDASRPALALRSHRHHARVMSL